jgi:hypothetical protein
MLRKEAVLALIIAFLIGGLIFSRPTSVRADQVNYLYFHQPVATLTATAIKDGPGFLNSVTVNIPGASGLVSIFDLGRAACTGTPSTNVIGLPTMPATGNPGTLYQQVKFNNGLCIMDTVAGSDLTVSYY